MEVKDRGLFQEMHTMHVFMVHGESRDSSGIIYLEFGVWFLSAADRIHGILTGLKTDA